MTSLRLTLCVLLTALAVAASACDDDGGGTAATPTSAGQATQTTSPTAEASPARTPPTGIDRFLIGTADMPAEWRITAQGEEARDVEFCGVDFPSEVEPADYGSVTFSNMRTALYVSEYISQYEGDGARDAFARLREATASCAEWEQKGPDGRTTVWRIGPLEVSALADESFGIVTRTEVETLGTVETQMVIMRRGEYLTWVSYGGAASIGIETAELERYAGIADGKLERGRGG